MAGDDKHRAPPSAESSGQGNQGLAWLLMHLAQGYVGTWIWRLRLLVIMVVGTAAGLVVLVAMVVAVYFPLSFLGDAAHLTGSAAAILGLLMILVPLFLTAVILLAVVRRLPSSVRRFLGLG